MSSVIRSLNAECHDDYSGAAHVAEFRGSLEGCAMDMISEADETKSKQLGLAVDKILRSEQLAAISPTGRTVPINDETT